MTVSRVVRGERTVSRATEAKVRAAIQRSGYQPDPALSALAAYRANTTGRRDGSTLAFLDCDGTDFSQVVLSGVRAEASLYGYRVDSHVLPVGETGQKRLSRTLFHRGVRGLCFGPSSHELDLRGWDWPRFAAVTLGALTHRPALHAVAMDYFGGAFSACRTLLGRGCRRVGFAVEPGLEARTGHRWLGGYVAALDGRPSLIYRGRWPAAAGFTRWLHRERIDGLLTIHAELLCDEQMHTRIKVCQINAAPAASPCAWTRLSLDPQRIGMEGVRLLSGLLRRREYGLAAEPSTVTLQGRWLAPAS